MAKIYHSEKGPKITAKTGITLTSASKVAIKAKYKEDATVELDGNIHETSKIQHVKTADTLNKVGDWTLFAYAEFEDGSVVYIGDACVMKIYEGP